MDLSRGRIAHFQIMGIIFYVGQTDGYPSMKCLLYENLMLYELNWLPISTYVQLVLLFSRQFFRCFDRRNKWLKIIGFLHIRKASWINSWKSFMIGPILRLCRVDTVDGFNIVIFLNFQPETDFYKLFKWILITFDVFKRSAWPQVIAHSTRLNALSVY